MQAELSEPPAAPPTPTRLVGSLLEKRPDVDATLSLTEAVAEVSQRLSACFDDIREVRQKQEQLSQRRDEELFMLVNSAEEQLSRRQDEADSVRRGQLDCISERIFQVEKELTQSTQRQEDAIAKANAVFEKHALEVVQERQNLMSVITQVNRNFEHVSNEMAANDSILKSAREGVAQMELTSQRISCDTMRQEAAIATVRQDLSLFDRTLQEQQRLLNESHVALQVLSSGLGEVKKAQNEVQSQLSNIGSCHRSLSRECADMQVRLESLTCEVTELKSSRTDLVTQVKASVTDLVSQTVWSVLDERQFPYHQPLPPAPPPPPCERPPHQLGGAIAAHHRPPSAQKRRDGAGAGATASCASSSAAPGDPGGDLLHSPMPRREGRRSRRCPKPRSASSSPSSSVPSSSPAGSSSSASLASRGSGGGRGRGEGGGGGRTRGGVVPLELRHSLSQLLPEAGAGGVGSSRGSGTPLQALAATASPLPPPEPAGMARPAFCDHGRGGGGGFGVMPQGHGSRYEPYVGTFNPFWNHAQQDWSQGLSWSQSASKDDDDEVQQVRSHGNVNVDLTDGKVETWGPPEGKSSHYLGGAEAMEDAWARIRAHADEPHSEFERQLEQKAQLLKWMEAR